MGSDVAVAAVVAVGRTGSCVPEGTTGDSVIAEGVVLHPARINSIRIERTMRIRGFIG